MKKVLCAIIALVLFALPSCGAPTPDTSLVIDVLEVGKADCIVIRQGGRTVMIDTGEAENAPEILHFLEQNKIHTIDTLILTHFDKDHIGGADSIFKQISVKEVIESTFSSDREEYDLYHETLSEIGVEPRQITEVTSFTLGDCHFTVDPPKKSSYEKKEDNNASLIVVLEFNGERFGFFGDALEERLSEYQSAYEEKLLFAKLPHHGSFHENYEDFLSHIDCKYAAITCSDKNDADEKTIQALEKSGIDYRLTKNGSIRLTYDKNSVTFNQ